MIDNETCEMIIDKFYDDIYNFCLSRLKNTGLAEECTQDVFLTLFQKRGRLDFSEKFRSWLYNTADRICKNCIKKNRNITVDIDDYSDVIPDNNSGGDSLAKELCEILGSDDADLLIEYLEADHGQRKQIARRLGITTKALYGRMDRLRQKVIDYLSDN
ncbi:MAG: sigma-70 family RNA polymerase sigma factor [Ruminococcus flavefaciens]|nr:sigma-70 family RNA polymerase sigma factor [Ruminococcus flavefaciens]MCM1231057.1 sigma-70 family RNA polymerase sigma factor [Ruminococcus flavefaciens]